VVDARHLRQVEDELAAVGGLGLGERVRLSVRVTAHPPNIEIESAQLLECTQLLDTVLDRGQLSA